MVRMVQRFLVAAVLVTGSLMTNDGAEASVPGTDRGCGKVSFEYSLARVDPGQVFDMDLGVENCSDRTERLRLHVRSSGPCDFIHPHPHTIVLPGRFAVFQSTLFVGPACPGRYSVRVWLTLRETQGRLDTAGDGFSVRR
jgi:hypothetical protein